MTADFEAAYQRQFSFLMRDKQIVVEAISVEAAIVGAGEAGRNAGVGPGRSGREGAEPAEYVRMFSGGTWSRVGLFRREALRPGETVIGPAVIAEDLATTVVEPGWRAPVTEGRDLLLTRVVPRPGITAIGTAADPVMLEIFGNLFMSIAEQMGVRLQSTAHSVNIKERLDFSCAIFDAAGGLIANAPHIPVHLGSMGESIKVVMERNREQMRPGDVYVLNDPYHGGTHLPDVTVVTPVFAPGPARADHPARGRAAVLRRIARASRGDRRHLAGVDARRQHARGRRRRADRQLAARARRPARRARDDRAAHGAGTPPATR